jgi:hypothetical protein
VRIESSPSEPLRTVYLWLTDSEATELRDALNDLLARPERDWHVHVSSADYQTEINVARDIT